MGHFQPRYPGKLFPRGDTKGMFSYGVGGMMWGKHSDGSDVLYVLMPARKGSMMHGFKTEGEGWNGNPLTPTFGREVRLGIDWIARVVGGSIVVYPGGA